jgi:hypothetical protein
MFLLRVYAEQIARHEMSALLRGWRNWQTR